MGDAWSLVNVHWCPGLKLKEKRGFLTFLDDPSQVPKFRQAVRDSEYARNMSMLLPSRGLPGNRWHTPMG